MRSENNNLLILLALAALLIFAGGDGCEFSPSSPSAIDRVTYVYEKDNTAVPRPVSFALQEISAAGTILASEFEQDTVTGLGDTPTQYRIALAAAKEAGLPALVVQAGERVVRIVKNPQTEEHVKEAIR